MKDRSIALLIVLFGLMLLGIIAIQAWWIRRSLRLSEQAFDSAVYRSLGEVVRQTEQKENFVFIRNKLQTDTILRQTKKLLKQHKRESKHAIAGFSNNVQVHVNTESGEEPRTIIRIENNENGKHTVRNSVIVGVQRLEQPEPPLPPEAPSPDNKIEHIEILVEKMLRVKDPDSISIKPPEIGRIIREELLQNNLSGAFEYALLQKDSFPVFKSRGYKSGSYRIDLYPNDLFGRNITLLLDLPQRDKLVRADIWWGFALSLVFTIAILILFAYSIHMLLRHRKMLAQKTDFINHLSHEFKTPLAGISLGADMLVEKLGQLNSSQVQFIGQTIKSQSTRLNKEVNDVLLSSRLEEDMKDPSSSFNVVSAIRQQLGLMELLIESRHAKIETAFSPEEIYIKGDELLWQKVFSNLVDNSLKFSKGNPVIKISVRKTGEKVRIEIADNGSGIHEKDLKHVFEKFYRSDYYKKSNIPGFGIGLSFVKKVLGASGASIRAESQPEKGTRMIIETNAA